MGRKNYQVIIIFLLWTLSACIKDKPTSPGSLSTVDSADKVFVVCEGSLGNGNSSLIVYDKKNGIVSGDVYKSANGQDLGDVFQSMVAIGDKLFLCINNSDKIVVVNRWDYKQVGVISIPKPRFILPVTGNKAYVSTLFSNKIYVIDPGAISLTAEISLPAQNPEGMLYKNGYAYVCAWDTATDKIFKINTATDRVQQEITVAGRAPQEIVEDRNQNLWVLSGNVRRGKQSALTVLHPDGSTIKSWMFPPDADVVRPVFNTAKEVLYFIEVNYDGGTEYNGVFRMSVDAAELPEEPFVRAEKYQYFWALGIEPRTDNIYIGDPKGFIQKGLVRVYNSVGSQVTEFSTGVGPGHFYFQ